MRHFRQRLILPLLAALLIAASGWVFLLPDSGAAAPRAAGPKPDQPDLAAEYFLAKRLPGGREIDIWQRYRTAERHMEGMPRAKALAPWEPLGPGNIGGRTRAIVIDPERPDIMYAAGVTGGVWKTLNGGRQWRPLADMMANIAVSSLAMDPSDSRILYAGTGEGVFRSETFRGAGIFKSTNSGRTWKRLDSTLNRDFRFVNDIVISSRDPRRLYAATRNGVWRSRNGGNTWIQILESRHHHGCLDLALAPRPDADVLLASCGSREQATVYRHDNAEIGRAWTAVLSETDMGRTSLAIAPSKADVVYALAASLGEPEATEDFEDALHAVFRSDRGGEEGSWTAVVRNDDPVPLNRMLLSRPSSAFRQECFNSEDDNNFTGQAWFDNVIAVDPTDPEVIFVGGIDLFRSGDGGRNWRLLSYWWFSPPSAHADHHALVFHPDYDGVFNRTLFVGNDGGVWKTRDALAPGAIGPDAACNPFNSRVRWEALNNSYAVTQFYHGLPFPDGRAYLGGTQDNGTVLGTDAARANGWTEISGGDGGYVAVDPGNPNILYVESQRGNLRKSVNGGRTFRSAKNGITDPDTDFAFITPFVMDPRKSRRLWIGGRSVWRTTNGANRWFQASQRLSDTAKVSAIAVAPTKPNRVVVGLSDGTVHRTDRALTASVTTEWSVSTPRADAFISWLAFDPFDEDVVYATSSTFDGRHVLASTDGGDTWQQIDGNGPRRLPNIPVHCLVVDPTNPRRLYIGTDRGVFVSTTGGRFWAVENTGFTRTITESLSIARRGGRTFLFAFTHGRGAWRVEIGTG